MSNSLSNKDNVPDSVHARQLEAMAFVARMKEAADRAGCGFVGGFISPDGEKFIMSNMDDDEMQEYLPDHLR